MTGPVPCPYKSLPETAYWRRAVTSVPPERIDPVVAPRFTFGPEARVATAGSCFAQHIARRLAASGFGYFVAEPGHPALDADTLRAFNYGTFSARYGNLYTPRHLLQLFERAYAEREPLDDMWTEEDGSLVDPFRPHIQPGGFESVAAFQADRAQHFAAVREIVERSDIFVFTLGLTEAWENARDGSAYALCPGCGAGAHDPQEHVFRNYGVEETAADMEAAIAFLRARNPDVRVLLTVSPVPLIATYSDQHVLAATTYSKSVLRVVAQMMRDRHDFVDYFPSYEIITSGFSRGGYFGPDLREVEEVGVSHAMRGFFANYLEGAPETDPVPARNGREAGAPPAAAAPASPPSSASEKFNALICDEERLVDP